MSKTQIIEKLDIKLVSPYTYCAVLHNDDTTPHDFVVRVLMSVYHKTNQEAVGLANQAHNAKSAVIARGTRNYLSVLSTRALTMAAQHGHKDFLITNELEE